MGAAAAVAIIIRKEKDLVAHFRAHDALSPSTAKTINDLGVHPDFAWTRLTRRAIVREASSGMFYLDEPSWAAHRYVRRKMAVTILAVMLAALALVGLASVFAARN